MDTLIPLVRSDRLRDIVSYKSKDYSFRKGEDKYIYISKIKININRNEYCFQIRDNQSEIRFYLSIEDSCIYLTNIQIYELLKQISNKIGAVRMRNILLCARNKLAKIDYSGLPFEVKFFSNSIPKGSILLPESNLEITYEYLFLLIVLIQDKSNYYWKLSSPENHKYIDGILRLFACLISTKSNDLLKKLGWDYNTRDDKYFYNEPKVEDPNITTKDIKGKEIKVKYYLTQSQYKDIIRSRNPSNFVYDGGTLK